MTGGEMVTVEFLCDNRGKYLPRNSVILQKRQEESYVRIREKGNLYGCGNIIKFSW